MAHLNDEGQWIITIAFIISVGIFFLGILINQSVLVGQTTAEAVNEFPKTEIQDLRQEVRTIYTRYSGIPSSQDEILNDLNIIGQERKTEVIDITPGIKWNIHFNNGVTIYDEEILYWDF
ncbi:MAG: hypothetical protein KO464_10395 [Candidatus Methanofastidiosum sp.]|nr:hypothetical protein [Methanofastidiosum sp.]